MTGNKQKKSEKERIDSAGFITETTRRKPCCPPLF